MHLKLRGRAHCAPPPGSGTQKSPGKIGLSLLSVLPRYILELNIFHEGKVYDSNLDMYSFGVMMLEMWFGKRAPGKLSSMSENEVTQHIDMDKLRSKGSFNPPPIKWVTLMMYCCHSDSCFRPTATDGKTVIQRLKRDFVK